MVGGSEKYLVSEFNNLEATLSNIQFESSPDILEQAYSLKITLDENLDNELTSKVLRDDINDNLMERIARLLSCLMGELRKRGMASFSDHTPLSLVKNCCQVEEVRWAAVILRKMFESTFRGTPNDEQKNFREQVGKYFDSISDDCKSLRYQFLDKHDLDTLSAAASDSEYNKGLNEILLEAKHQIPLKVTLDAWEDCAIPKKMWMRLKGQTPETLFASAPNKKCFICETAELTSESNFVVVDHCYHIFCDSCIEAKFVAPKNGYCPGCNMLVTAWATKEVIEEYLKLKLKGTSDDAMRSPTSGP